MTDSTTSKPDPQVPKEWTLMFYFASDNPLAPNVVSQLKSIKNAGYHNDVNVITKFDPNTAGTPTHIFDVNLANKLTNPDDGFHTFPANDPFVRSLVMDKLWGNTVHQQSMRTKIGQYLAEKRRGAEYDPPIPKDEAEVGPKVSLDSFLKFCAENYPARHYMLFIMGHGLVVGNHTFLFDADADQAALSLKDFSVILKEFKKSIKSFGELELLGLHSCSMSSLELAYELEGTANYMLASQGPNFVGSWPYREILIRVCNDQKVNNAGERPCPKETILRIFRYILCNSFDFQLAGYSFDLTLCDLRQARRTRVWLNELTRSLIAGLKAEDPLLRELILLAHWEAQSYWQETYTDLFDFCFCLSKRCHSHYESASEPRRRLLARAHEACSAIMKMLKPSSESGEAGLVACAEFAGPEFQYSHGLSVYFPWSQPSDKSFWPLEYSSYEFKETGWGEFLGEYFTWTQRKPVWVEIEQTQGKAAVPVSVVEQQLLEEMLYCVGASMELSIASTEYALAAGDKAGGASALSIGDKAGGSSALGVAINGGNGATVVLADKAGGASALGLGDKAGGASALGLGDKAGGASALGLGDKAGGASALGLGDKAGGASALGLGDKAGGASALGNVGNGNNGATLALGDKPGGASALNVGDKPGGASGLGDGGIPSIKNYPKYTRHRPTSAGFFEMLRLRD